MLKTKDSWDKLSMFEKADLIKYAVQNGIYNPNTVRQAYNEFAEGGEKDGEMTRVRRANGEYAFVKTKDGHAITDGTGRYPLYNSSGTVIGTGVGDSFPYVGNVRDEGYLDEITVTPQGMQTQDTTYSADALLKAAQQAERNKEIARNRAIDAKVSQYAFTPEGFFDVATRPAMTLLSPTNTTRALWDIGEGVLTGEGSGNIAQRLFTHNNGWFPDDFAREHPYLTMAGNMLGDAATFGTVAALRNMPKYRAAMQAENKAAQEAVANQWDSIINRDTNNLFRTRVYKGGPVKSTDTFLTTDRNYAANYGPVSEYIFETKRPAIAQEPLMGYQDPVNMDMFVYRNTKSNPTADAIIGHDKLTGEFAPSNGTEIYSLNPKKHLTPINESPTVSFENAVGVTPEITAENAASVTSKQGNAGYRTAALSVQEDAEYLTNPVLKRKFLEANENVKNGTASDSDKRFIESMKKVINTKRGAVPISEESKQEMLEYYGSKRYRDRVLKNVGDEEVADAFIDDALQAIKNTPIERNPLHPQFTKNLGGGVAEGVTLPTRTTPKGRQSVIVLNENAGQDVINHEINHAVDFANSAAIESNKRFPLKEVTPSKFIQNGKPYMLDDIEPRTRAISLDMFLAKHPEFTIDDAYKSWYDPFNTNLSFNDLPIDARNFIVHYTEETGRNYFDNFYSWLSPLLLGGGTAATLYGNGQE